MWPTALSQPRPLPDRRRRLLAIADDSTGIASVEYAVIIGIIALAIAGGFSTLSGKLITALSNLPI